MKKQQGKKKKLSNSQNTFFFSFGLLRLSSFKLSHFFFILNNLQCYRSIAFNSTNCFLTLITTKQHIRNFLGDWESALQLSMVFCFFFLGGEFLTLSTLVGHNFFNFKSFLKDFQCITCVNKRGSNFVLFRDQKTPKPSHWVRPA